MAVPCQNISRWTGRLRCPSFWDAAFVVTEDFIGATRVRVGEGGHPIAHGEQIFFEVGFQGTPCFTHEPFPQSFYNGFSNALAGVIGEFFREASGVRVLDVQSHDLSMASVGIG